MWACIVWVRGSPDDDCIAVGCQQVEESWQQLDTMEDVELMAVHDVVIETLETGRIEASVE